MIWVPLFTTPPLVCIICVASIYFENLNVIYFLLSIFIYALKNLVAKYSILSMHLYTISIAFSSLPSFLFFSYYHFPSAWRVFFTISLRVSLLAKDSSGFLLSGNIFILNSYFKDVFTIYRNLHYEIFQHFWKNLLLFPLVIYNFVIFLHPLIISLSLIFSGLTNCTWFSLRVYLLGFSEFLKSLNLRPLLNLQSIQPLFLQTFFLH